jgi:Predicted membrane protein
VTRRRSSTVKHLSRRVTALVRVFLSGSIGVVVAAVAASFTPWQVSSLLAWDTGAALFCASVWVAVHGADATTTQRIATREDDSRSAADLVLIAASVASLLGVGFALLQASAESGVPRALTTTVAVATVVLSWLAVQTVFTLRYAHLYYLDGGIDFHNEQAPDYGDFAYVAFTLGMTYQVSDTDLTSKKIRTTALRQALLSYVFGIAVIAITINVVARLLGR